MTTFLISYDLAAPQSNRHALSSAIMMLGQSWARPLDSTWYIKTDIAERDVEAILSGLLGEEDGLLVQAVDKAAVLANTTLRWFRQRRAPVDAGSDNVVAFPVVTDMPAVAEPYPMAEAV